MKAFLAVTDNDWFSFLSRQPDLDEVNFWQPGGKVQFKALERGEPFLFKLKAPASAIAGGGFFEHASIVPISLAWDAFQEKNGATSLERMFRLIAPLKAGGKVTVGDPIGCVILRDPFFFDRDQWIKPPDSFAKNIVTGKTFDLRTGEGAALWREVQLRLQAIPTRRVSEALGPTYGGLTTVRTRLGQGTFRVRVTDIYGRKCAVTRERALPVLEAAHIQPVSRGGEHRLDNGLLLRSDVHRLFDDGYVTITPDYTFRVSDALKAKFDDGETYRPFALKSILLPEDELARPNRELLEWHNSEVFQG